MTTREKIDALIEDQFSGYRGKYNKPLKILHAMMRIHMTEKQFLAFLEKQKVDNPKPEYVPPPYLLNQ